MKRADVQTFVDQFNAASDSLRVVSLLSPTCLVCQYGAGVLQTVFDVGRSEDLKGFVAWIPMMKTDGSEAAEHEAGRLSVPHVEHLWDADKALANVFAETLGLRCPAWDVYLLYAPGLVWSGEIPPQPTFWMHQLPVSTGADPGLLLAPGPFLDKLLGFFGRSDEVGHDLALLAHANALSVVLAPRRNQASLDEVVAASVTE